MKTSQLFSLVLAFTILSTSTFAGNTKTETNDSSIDSSEELYVNPLEEVLAMQAIPDIILDDNMTSTSWLYVNAEEEYLNPLNEVLEMENIPEVNIATSLRIADEEYTNPLQEVLEMEAIPTIKLDSEFLANSK